MRTPSRFFVIIGLLTVPMLVAAATFFSDTENSPYAASIEELRVRGIIAGYDDGTFRPEKTINRAEFLKILIEARFPDHEPNDLFCFTDLEVKVPQWYAHPVCVARELGIVEGYPDGLFRPEKTVNLAEALKMAFRTFGIATQGSSDVPWYEQYLEAARTRNILLPLLKTPAHLLTRGEMASLTAALVLEAEESPPANPGICGNGVQEAAEQCDDGNVQDSDGCSSICIIVPEPVRRAILQIEQLTTGSFTTVAQGQTDVALLKFTAVAGRQDAVLTSLTFEASIGSLLYASHYELVMDRNGDGVYEKVAQSEGKVTANRLVFDKLLDGGIVIPDGLIVPFLVRADLVSSYGPVTIGLKFATSLPDYVQAQGAVDNLQLEGVETDNVCTAPNCFIRVNTVGSTDINVQDAGNLYVTEDPLPTRSHMLLGGSITDELLRLRVHADGDSIDLKTIRIDGVPASVDALLLYRAAPGQRVIPGSATAFAQATNGQCPQQNASRFCVDLGINTLVISPTEDTVIVVAARMKTDQLGAVSGQMLTPVILSATTGDDAAFEARSVSSSKELTQNNGNGTAGGEIFVGTATPAPNGSISGDTHDIGLASIGSVVNDGPAEVTSIPAGFASFARFKISALPHSNSFHGSNDVLLQSMTFRVTAQNVQLDPASVMLSTSADPSIQLNCSAPQSTGSFDVTCLGLSDNLQNRIGQGQNVVYVLSANITNAQISPGTSILSASLATLGQRSQTNSIQWSDEETVFQWVDVPEVSVNGTVYRK